MADGAGAPAFEYPDTYGFSQPSGSSHRDPPLPIKYFPSKDCFWVGPKGSAKSTFVQFILHYPTGEACVRSLFKEVIVSGTQLQAGLDRRQSSNWNLLRLQYEIDEESDASPDGFFRVFPTLDVETYKEEIQGRDIDGLRLIIGDDWPAHFGELLGFLEGRQRAGAGEIPISNLSLPLILNNHQFLTII